MKRNIIRAVIPEEALNAAERHLKNRTTITHYRDRRLLIEAFVAVVESGQTLTMWTTSQWKVDGEVSYEIYKILESSLMWKPDKHPSKRR